MGGAVTLFRIAGIPVRVHASWLIIYGLIAWSLSVGYFPRVVPDVPVLTHWASGLVAALLLFVSVFLHELSHSIVARAHGLPVSAITLHVFGGVSELGREPESPGVEFRMAIVDGEGLILVEQNVIAQGDQMTAPGGPLWTAFDATVGYAVGQSQTGSLIVWAVSVVDGSQIAVREYPVHLVPWPDGAPYTLPAQSSADPSPRGATAFHAA